jgi:hypothetical protein
VKIEAFITRRLLLAVSAAALAGCTKQSPSTLSASAARNSERVHFRYSMAWVGRSENGYHTVTIAFLPFDIDDDTRIRILGNRGVFPIVAQKEKMLELRIELEKPDSGNKIGVENLRAVQFAFWNFDEPTPVVRFERTDWTPSSDLEIVGLDGEFRRSGYVVGTFRGKHIYKNDSERDDVYLWNVEVTNSLP